jgi:hypothetical protein
LKSEIEEVFRLQVIYRWAVTAHPAFRTSRFGNADPNRPTNVSSYGTPTRRENRAVNRDYVRGAFRPSSDIVPVHSSDRRIATFILAFRRTGGVTSPRTPHGLLPRPKYHYAI